MKRLSEPFLSKKTDILACHANEFPYFQKPWWNTQYYIKRLRVHLQLDEARSPQELILVYFLSAIP